jgi:hypothetical protein
MDCERLHDVADELALELLTGTERAAALDHLEQCEACRDAIARLAVTADLVLLAAPASPPPPGFETEVLARIEAIGTRDELPVGHRPRRVRAALAAAAAVLGVLIFTLMPDGRGPSVSAARMRTSDGTVVGTARMQNDDPAGVVVNVTDWRKADARGSVPPYRLWIEREDGTRQLVGLPSEVDYSWRVGLPADGADVVGVALVDREGTILCSGEFAAS